MKYFLTSFALFILTVPVFAFGAYKPLVGIPGVSDTQNFDEYLQAIYAAAISLAALLAVIKIVIAGVKWMTTDIVTAKGDAKKDIEGAVFGLVLILGAVLILYIINPNIGTVDLTFTTAPKQAIPEGTLMAADVEACQDAGPDLCTFEKGTCGKDYGFEYAGGNNSGTPDCTTKAAQCLGDWQTEADGKSGYCLTTAAAKAAKLTEIASANCTPGDSCSGSVCTGGTDALCQDKCLDGLGAVHYDAATRVCVKSEDAVYVQVNDILTGPTLGGKIVTNGATVFGFNAAAGAEETYHLAKMPAELLNIDIEYQNIVSFMEQACALVAESKSPSEEMREDISVEIKDFEGETYVGCVRS